MTNGTILQFFHWYITSDGSLWHFLKKEAKRLASMGITAVWIPPASKGSKGANSEGYDIYDLYDLGEFDQKGSVRTKYGTKAELIAAIEAVHDAGMQIYVDIVFNHLAGADGTEIVKVRKVNPDNRNEFISEPYEIEAYTKFVYPGRKDKYSAFKWDYLCFTGVDCDKRSNECAIYTIQNEYGEGWEDVADTEFGNYDYLMSADIEYRNPAVREEVKRWGEWFWKLTKFDGIRMDAVKHIAPGYIKEWLDHMNAIAGKKLFTVGEYWAPEQLGDMERFIEGLDGKMSLFDAPLHHNFFEAARCADEYDLRTIFDNTLVQKHPNLAVTIVGNHDTQPLQLLQAEIEPWFKDMAYSLILLRNEGYPCVFYPDLYGARYNDKDQDVELTPLANLEKLLQLRQRFAYGPQNDYLDYPTCIGWTREGDDKHEHSGCAVLLSSGEKGDKKMNIGKRHAGKTFKDYLQNSQATVTIQADGIGEFHCEAKSISIWVPA